MAFQANAFDNAIFLPAASGEDHAGAAEVSYAFTVDGAAVLLVQVEGESAYAFTTEGDAVRDAKGAGEAVYVFLSQAAAQKVDPPPPPLFGRATFWDDGVHRAIVQPKPLGVADATPRSKITMLRGLKPSLAHLVAQLTRVGLVTIPTDTTTPQPAPPPEPIPGASAGVLWRFLGIGTLTRGTAATGEAAYGYGALASAEVSDGEEEDPVIPGGLENFNAYETPSLTLPNRHETYVDPVFGTTVMRVTDATDGTLNRHYYSYVSPFNWGSTRFIITCDSTNWLYTFDPANFQIVSRRLLRTSSGDPLILPQRGTAWDRRESHKYIHYGAESSVLKLWQIDTEADSYTLLKDFTGLVEGARIWQVQVSDDGDYFSFGTRTSGGAFRGGYVWRRSTDTLFTFPYSSIPDTDGITHPIIAGDGSYVYGRLRPGSLRSYYWNFHTGDYFVCSGSSCQPWSHFAIGRGPGLMSGDDPYLTGISRRTYDPVTNTLGSKIHLLAYRVSYPDGALDWTKATHNGMNEQTDARTIVSTYGSSGFSNPFQREVFFVKMDGGTPQRLAHTRSAWPGEYEAEPQAATDMHGRFAMWKSSVMTTNRVDVLMVRIPTAFHLGTAPWESGSGPPPPSGGGAFQESGFDEAFHVGEGAFQESGFDEAFHV